MTYGTNTNTEMLFVYSFGQDKAKIYKFSEGDFKETDYAEIGSGKNTKSLSTDVQIMIKMAFIETNGQLHNIHFSRYIRRDLDKTDYAFFFSLTLLKVFL